MIWFWEESKHISCCAWFVLIFLAHFNYHIDWMFDFVCCLIGKTIEVKYWPNFGTESMLRGSGDWSGIVDLRWTFVSSCPDSSSIPSFYPGWFSNFKSWKQVISPFFLSSSRMIFKSQEQDYHSLFVGERFKKSNGGWPLRHWLHCWQLRTIRDSWGVLNLSLT